jgi:hypothetical protein
MESRGNLAPGQCETLTVSAYEEARLYGECGPRRIAEGGMGGEDHLFYSPGQALP